MTWDKFVVLWSREIDTSIPQASVHQWQQFVASANDSVLIQAVKNVAEKHLNLAEKGVNKKPVLAQLQFAYDSLRKEQREARGHKGCDFCDHEVSATVYVLDNGNYSDGNFPPDPATWQGRRCLGSVPCPCCRANEYAVERTRERVQKYARPFAKRNELLSAGVAK